MGVGHGPAEVLSQSLKETQRQCDSVNQEMAQQAEGNEKLVESMGSVEARESMF